MNLPLAVDFCNLQCFPAVDYVTGRDLCHVKTCFINTKHLLVAIITPKLGHLSTNKVFIAVIVVVVIVVVVLSNQRHIFRCFVFFLKFIVGWTRIPASLK